ncbi:MAG: hypothetical protein P1P90_01450 [Patescibacteria group bacterium]|nr:hypothetical protein [Patescibacteria group bacterium]
MKKNISLIAIKFCIFVILLLGGFVLGASTTNAALEKFDVVEPKCPAGQTYTKPSPGIGPTPCGLNQCRPDGYLFFTACLSDSDCGKVGGITDGGNKAGCSDVGGTELFCCRVSKNRCKASNDPSKLYLCTNKQQCESLGKVEGLGGACDGEYDTCCEIPDSATAPMKIIGEPLLLGTTVDPSGTQRDLLSGTGSGSTNKVKRAYEYIDNFCFTQLECAEGGGTFEKGNGCPFKGDQVQGYCVAPEPEYELQYPIFGATKISGLRNFIGLLFNGAIGVLLIASAIFFIWGSFKYLVSSVASSIQNSKSIMIDSLVGLALGLGAYAILANVNPNLLALNPGKIYMINRVSFYDVVYCNDLINKNAKLMDAGTPSAPLSYSEQFKKTGFDKSIKDAICGKEYFIEGGDSLAVCMGQSCGNAKNNICMNCSNGLSEDCKSNSTIEHGCAECKIGGKVILASRFKPRYAYAYLFCGEPKGTSMSFEVLELADIAIPDQNSNAKSSGAAAGTVSNYCIKDLPTNSAEEFMKSCDGKNAEYKGMFMVIGVDEEFTLAPDAWVSIKEKVEKNPFTTIIRTAGYALGPIPAVVSAVYDGNKDNLYYTVNKNMCNSNLLDTSLPFTKAFFKELVSADESGVAGAIENMFDYSLESGAGRTKFFDGLFGKDVVWSFDETRDIIKNGMSNACGVTINP